MISRCRCGTEARSTRRLEYCDADLGLLCDVQSEPSELEIPSIATLGTQGRELDLEPIQHGSRTPKRSAFAATAGVAVWCVGLFLFFIVELDIIAEPHVVLLGDPGEIALDRQVGIGDDAQFLRELFSVDG